MFSRLGYISNDQSSKAVDLFHKTRNPSDVTYTLLFNACAQLGSTEALNIIKKVAKDMPKLYYSNDHIVTSLLDSLIECDDIPYARSLFQSLKQKSSTVYAVMMNACTKEENPFGAIDLFNQMKNDGIQANKIVHINLIKSLAKLGDYSTCQSIIPQMSNIPAQ